MNLMDILATLTGYGLLGLAGLAVGLACLLGLLLGAIVGIGHLARRRRDDDPEAQTSHQERGSALASFRWEEAQED